ncbi:glutamine synthetase family protein [Marinoscillum furvescens]|uniref:Glutamine synthetase n=1 Tax=Marinoscillum furvescens DSM 4134 TaxID=1122208 RepID=A0A3D9L1S8_MARFU|nr:glutamine synthetase family protein [Marinoscillum furvescens]RED98016.1 glutamine synthetase [Marinoscillum furvescens DSM 4134]
MKDDLHKTIEQLKSSEETRVKVAVVDIDGVLRGKIVHKKKLLSLLEQGAGFCDVIFGWDVADELYDNTSLTGWHTGYPDTPFHVDVNTLRSIPWEENIPFLLGDFSASNHPACPRSLFKSVLDKAKSMGFETAFAQEFEWFNFQETPESIATKEYQNPTPLTPGMFGYSILRASQNSPYFHDLFTLLEAFDIPLEGLHTETGPGVYEACIQYTDGLRAADRAVLLKAAVKEIAAQHGIMPSFMAKWHQDLPGCSGHIHQSLWKDELNVFHDAADPHGISETLRHYIAGQLHALPHILPLYAPTVNSYKRLVEGAWAPTTLTWGHDNRTTALRTISTSATSTRLETRVPGADVNPYLAMAAALASGLYGIEHKLELNTPATIGNGYENNTAEHLPKSLHQATEKMNSSVIAKELFGEEFTSHFCKTREWECRQFAKAVTNWELKRYFEII